MTSEKTKPEKAAGQEPWRYRRRDGESQVWRGEGHVHLVLWSNHCWRVDSDGESSEHEKLNGLRLLCEELAEYLNAQRRRPVWLADFEPGLPRKGDPCIECADGMLIVAVDPHGDETLARCLLDSLIGG